MKLKTREGSEGSNHEMILCMESLKNQALPGIQEERLSLLGGKESNNDGTQDTRV